MILKLRKRLVDLIIDLLMKIDIPPQQTQTESPQLTPPKDIDSPVAILCELPSGDVAKMIFTPGEWNILWDLKELTDRPLEDLIYDVLVSRTK